MNELDIAPFSAAWWDRLVMAPETKIRFRRTDGLVDGGTIEHLEELQAAQRRAR